MDWKRLENIWLGCMLGITLANVFLDGFPALPAMYLLTTGFSVLLGFGCLCGSGYAPAWEQRNVPKDVQKKATRVMGVLYLLNAALCPLGWLLNRFVRFDTDFILLAQIIGLPVICLLGLFPRFLAGKQYN